MRQVDDVLLHRDNRQGRYEHARWVEDVARWEAEHAQAAAWLLGVQESWDRTEAAMRAHGRLVRAHELRLLRHEKAISDSWFDGSDAEHERLATEHERLLARHKEIEEVHERLREHHEAIMAEIPELLKISLEGAMVQETLA
ncbi:MAG TPA: hypothetical protein VE890_09805 [Thermoguttaceae bacterium]|nr:hypothetical protein [Thermoguttaceae bacterium]